MLEMDDETSRPRRVVLVLYIVCLVGGLCLMLLSSELHWGLFRSYLELVGAALFFGSTGIAAFSSKLCGVSRAFGLVVNKISLWFVSVAGFFALLILCFSRTPEVSIPFGFVFLILGGYAYAQLVIGFVFGELFLYVMKLVRSFTGDHSSSPE